MLLVRFQVTSIQLVSKFLRSQKLYLDFWLWWVGAPNPHIVQGSTVHYYNRREIQTQRLWCLMWNLLNKESVAAMPKFNGGKSCLSAGACRQLCVYRTQEWMRRLSEIKVNRLLGPTWLWWQRRGPCHCERTVHMLAVSLIIEKMMPHYWAWKGRATLGTSTLLSKGCADVWYSPPEVQACSQNQKVNLRGCKV